MLVGGKKGGVGEKVDGGAIVKEGVGVLVLWRWRG